MRAAIIILMTRRDRWLSLDLSSIPATERRRRRPPRKSEYRSSERASERRAGRGASRNETRHKRARHKSIGQLIQLSQQRAICHRGGPGEKIQNDRYCGVNDSRATGGIGFRGPTLFRCIRVYVCTRSEAPPSRTHPDREVCFLASALCPMEN